MMKKRQTKKNAKYIFGVSLQCAKGANLCLDQNLPRKSTRPDWPFHHFQSRRQCLLGAGHEILYVAKRLCACRVTSSHSLFSFRAPWNCTKVRLVQFCFSSWLQGLNGSKCYFTAWSWSPSLLWHLRSVSSIHDQTLWRHNSSVQNKSVSDSPPGSTDWAWHVDTWIYVLSYMIVHLARTSRRSSTIVCTSAAR